eukprot:29273-Pelagomonas_calceolata.AAC.5
MFGKIHSPEEEDAQSCAAPAGQAGREVRGSEVVTKLITRGRGDPVLCSTSPVNQAVRGSVGSDSETGSVDKC